MFRNSLIDETKKEEYVSSSDQEKVLWIQPSIVYENIETAIDYLKDGMYSVSVSLEFREEIDLELIAEINEWESASAYDFFSFESSLDE